MTSGTSAGSDLFETEAEAILFGYPSTGLHVTLRQRSRGWRLGGAARIFGTAIVVAPFVALFPPHAVWPVGALLTGGFLARRRATERFSLVELAGDCPKCGGSLSIPGGRLRIPHPLACDACHHQSTLKLPDGLLEGRSTD